MNQPLLFLIISLSTMTPFIISLPCQRRNDIQAAQVLRRLQQKYIFVKKKTSSDIPLLTTTPFPQRRITRDSSNIPGTTFCPWVWGRDEDPARVPRTLVKALCPGCVHYCRPVYYHHRILIPKCDKTTGHKVWKWKEKKLAVAYVYDPYN